MRAATVCNEPGCPNAARKNGRCHRHQRRNGSTYAWRKLRARVLARDHGRCVYCGRPAAQVHHLRAIGEGGPELPPLRKLVSVCADCHRGL